MHAFLSLLDNFKYHFLLITIDKMSKRGCRIVFGRARTEKKEKVFPIFNLLIIAEIMLFFFIIFFLRLPELREGFLRITGHGGYGDETGYGETEIDYDINGDGCVDSLDSYIMVWNVKFGSNSLSLDINGDGVVDYDDLSLVREHLGEGDCPEEKKDEAEEPEEKIIPIEEVPDEKSPPMIPKEALYIGDEGCEVSLECGEWSECATKYSVQELVKGGKVSGEKYRYCIDALDCVSDFIERVKCEKKIEITTKKVIWCSEEYTEIYDKFRNLIARMKPIEDILNIRFIAVGEGYCAYCHDNIKNYDEEGVDCGGSCRDC